MKRCLYGGLIPAPGKAKSLLESHGIEISEASHEREMSETDLLALIDDHDATIAGSAPYTKKVIDSSSGLKIIARVGVGYDKVDVEAASARGIYVTLTPIPELAYTLAEHTFALILGYTKQICRLNRDVREGVWMPQETWSFTDDLYHKTIGLLGLGRIGIEVAKRSRAFGMRTTYFDVVRRQDLETSLGITYVPLDQLLSESDVLSIHTPLNNETRGIIDEKAIRKMRRNTLLVNTARGPIVDEAPLLQALRENRIGGACLDVIPEEPPSPRSLFYRLGEEYSHLLITPHCAVSGHTINLMVTAAAEEVVRVLDGGKPLYSVNTPVSNPA